MKKFLSGLLAAAMIVTSAVNMPVKAADASPMEDVKSSDIVVLYDNDAHCAADNYDKVAALKDEALEKTQNVAMVSCGDFIQGGTLGTLSKGQAIIDIMNEVGYDVVTLGNHEFDYAMPQLKKLTKKLNAKVVSCNFRVLKTNKPVYKGYTTKTYAGKKIAFVGITTPEAITKSTPVYFQNSKGKYLYGFCNDKTGKALYKQVQKTVDTARKNGADYVVAVSHLGMAGTTPYWTSKAVIENTKGIDILLDGHSHEKFASTVYQNAAGKDVICSQTGSKLENVGRLVISEDGTMTTSLISIKDYEKKNEAVTNTIKAQNDKYASMLKEKIGETKYLLTVNKPDSDERGIRTGETNLGDFCTDAYRKVLGADIALVNGGGIRANIEAGEITRESIIKVFPFGNMGCVIQATGQQIKDALELGAMNYPNESGGFLQVSGMKYTIDSTIESSVKTDENKVFVSVEGKYRVKNVKVYNKKTKKYEALKLTKKYTIAGVDYTLRQSGDGMSMFKGCKVIKDNTIGDAEVLMEYLSTNLKGVVGKTYANQAGSGRITIK